MTWEVVIAKKFVDKYWYDEGHDGMPEEGKDCEFHDGYFSYLREYCAGGVGKSIPEYFRDECFIESKEYSPVVEVMWCGSFGSYGEVEEKECVSKVKWEDHKEPPAIYEPEG